MNGRESTLTELQDANAALVAERDAALASGRALAEVLNLINQSPRDLTVVFDAILEKALNLCDSEFGVLAIREGEFFRVVAMRNLPPAFEQIASTPLSAQGPGGPLGRIAAGEPWVQTSDLADSDSYRAGDAQRRAMVDLGGARTVLAVGLSKSDAVLGTLIIYRQEVRPYTDREITLLQSFATQAVIAMENARLITEQHEALAQQTAAAEVLRVINANPGDLKPVFDVMLEKAMQLCGAAFAEFHLWMDEGWRIATWVGLPPAYAQFYKDGRQSSPLQGPRAPDSLGARVVNGERIAHVPDLADTQSYANGEAVTHALVDLGGARTALGIGLRSDRTLLGGIVIYRQEVKLFSEKQIALLQGFADQAVIAMENARLLTEQGEALERQNAMAEVLQVINANPGDPTPVFETLLDKAMTLCGVAFGEMFLVDGSKFVPTVMRGVKPEFAAVRLDPNMKTSASANSVTRRLLAGESIVQIADVRDSDLYRSGDPSRVALVDLGGARTTLGLALRKDGVLLGGLNLFRQEVKPFTDKQIALLQDFSAQAVIAIENARLLNEVRQRQEELDVTFENMSDGVAMFDENYRLVAWNRNFREILDVPEEVFSARQTYEDYIRYLTARGEFGPNADPEAQIRRLSAFTRQSVVFERTRPNGQTIEVHFNPIPTGGFVLIYTDVTERKRNEEALRTARDAAEEASRTIESAYRELKVAQANLVQAEKMASLGQLTAGIAHEIKNPLNFVNNFASLSGELLAELNEVAEPGFAALDERSRAEVEDLAQTLSDNLAKITEHGKRADGIVKSMLEHSRGVSTERRAEDLNSLVEEALNLAYHGARAQDPSFNVTLERDFATAIAPIELNPQEITRVCLNLIGNGFYAVRKRQGLEGGDFEARVKVSTRDLSDAVEIRVRDNGIGISADIRDKLFEPFFTTKPTGEGTGLGLSISYDIVRQQHGGMITVDSEPGVYTEFTVRLPRSSVDLMRE